MPGRPADPDPAVPWTTLAAVAAGGVAGALARFALSGAFPYGPGEFPWVVFWINVSGCLAIGVLMVLVTETALAGRRGAHRLVRPFLGTGVLGGFTTFSAYAVDVQRSMSAGAVRVGLAYLGLTLAAALAAVLAGTLVTRALARRFAGGGA